MKVTIRVFTAALVLLLVGACSTTTTTNNKQSTARSALADKGIAFTDVAFISAAKYGKTEIVKDFIVAGMDVNANIDGTALIAATAAKNLDMVKLLIENGADVNETNYLGSSLSAAVYVGNYDIAKYLIDNGANVNLAADDGTTPMIVAAQTGQGEMVELLANTGANVNYVVPVTEMTPLILASARGNASAVEQLIKAGANVNYKDASGIPVLAWALLANNLDIAKALIKNGANPNINRVIIAALAHGDADFVGYLIKDEGVNVNGYAFGKMPFVVWCAKNNLPKSAEILIKFGADTKAKDSNGCTALDYALSNKEYDLVRILDPSIDTSTLPKKEGDPNLKASDQQFDEAKMVHAATDDTGTDGIDSLQKPSVSAETVVPGEGQVTSVKNNEGQAMLSDSTNVDNASNVGSQNAAISVVPGEDQKTVVTPSASGTGNVLSSAPGKQETFDPTAK